jgi:type VI secretion system secreted protein Hcp
MKHNKLTQRIAGLLLAIITITQINAAAYIKFDGIGGEAKSEGHEGWIEILSFNQGIHKPKQGASGSTRRRSAAVFGDLTVAKELDKSSPKLAEAVATGRVIPRVTLDVTVATERGEMTYYRYELTNVLVTSYQVSMDNPELLPMDSFSLNFEKIKVTYTGLEFGTKGESGDLVEYSWKVEEGEN